MTTPITKTQALAKCKPLLYAAVGVLSTLGVLSLAHVAPAQAQGPGVNLAALLARLSADEAVIATLKGNPIPGPKGDKGDTGPQGVKGDTGPAGTGSIAALTQVGKDVFFTGVNVHIVSGSGSTDDGGTLSGLGNLILGYNALGNDLGAGDVRTGSHNLVLGRAVVFETSIFSVSSPWGLWSILRRSASAIFM